MTIRVVLAGLVLTTVAAAGCEEKSCTALSIVREMTYEAALPASVEPTAVTLEYCFGLVCDRSRLARSANPNVVGLICEDLDGRTPTFPTRCTYDESARTLTLTTNTVEGGHGGDDELVVTAITSSGARTELLRGTVTYEDTTDDSARAACTVAWKGTFTKR